MKEIIVDEFWWDDLCKRVARAKSRNLSEYGMLVACAEVVVAARVVVESHRVMNHGEGKGDVPDLPQPDDVNAAAFVGRVENAS